MSQPTAARPAPTVRVVCDAERNRRGRVVQLATFERADEGWRERRQRLPGSPRTGDMRVNPFTRQVVIAGRGYDPECLPIGASMRPGAYPARYVFRCLLCGLDVQVTEPAWFAALDKLRDRGVSAVRLSALARSIGALA